MANKYHSTQKSRTLHDCGPLLVQKYFRSETRINLSMTIKSVLEIFDSID